MFISLSFWLCACSAGGGTPPFGSPSTSPVGGLPSQIPFSSTNGRGFVSLPAALSAPAGDSAFAIASTSQPNGAPALPTTGGATSIFYLSLGFSQPTTFSAQPGISYTLLGIDPTKGPIYLAELRPGSTVWQQPFAGPAETFTGSAQILISTGTTTYPSGSPVIFALYQTINPIFPIVLSPNTVTLSTKGQSIAVSASAASYSGAFTATSQNTAVATDSPSSGTSFAITAVGAGTTTVVFTDTKGATTALPVTVAFAPIVLSTTTQAFTSIGQTQSVTATVAGYAGVMSAVSANPSVASVTSNGGGNFTLKATGMGSTTMTFSDTDGTTTPLSVTVAFAPIVLSVTSQAFTSIGQTQSVSASVAGYSGLISAVSANSSVTSVTANGGGNFTLKAIGAGSTTITFSDTNGTTAPLPVTVTFAPIVVSPSTQAFTAIGQTQTLTATVAGYTGTINAVSNNTGIATITSIGGGQFTLRAVASGSTTITFSDANGTTTNFPVSVTLTGGGITVPGAPWTITELGSGSFTAAPSGIVSGPDHNLWFTEPTTDNYGYMTLGGAVTEYPFTLPGGSRPTAIASGTDGNLYMAESLTNAIAISTTSGFIINQPPTSGSPVALSVASNGGMWAAVLPNALCPVSLSGVGTCITTPSTALSGLANGPDGRLWFAQNGNNTIAAMSIPGFTFASYPIPTANAGVTALASGSDGNMWFTESNTNKIARITTAGVVTEFTTPIAGGVPTALTLGSDGNLYAIDTTHNDLIRMTTNGIMTVISLTTTSPQFLTSGTDGNLYVTQATPAAMAQVIP